MPLGQKKIGLLLQLGVHMLELILAYINEGLSLLAGRKASQPVSHVVMACI